MPTNTTSPNAIKTFAAKQHASHQRIGQYNISRKMVCRIIIALLISTSAWQWSQALVISGKANLAQWLIASAWQATLDTGQTHKPWPWADTWPVAKIVFTGSNNTQHNTRSFYILAGSTGNSLAFGPGHASDTALPATTGASVIGGHRDTHFSLLEKVQHDDNILVQNQQGEWKTYYVNQYWVADSHTTPLYIDTEQDDLYLITCYPFNSISPNGSERFVVKATLNDAPYSL